MKSISAIKKEEEIKVSQLITDCGMFFAFSNEQFAENKTPLQEGEKYISLQGGAFMPKGKLELWRQGMKDIREWYKTEVANNKARKSEIIYELNNHEAFYTYDIESTLDALGSDYTKEEVWKVFHDECKKQLQ